MPNYMSKAVDGYLMNAEGNSFDVTPAGGSAPVPFRPYFTGSSASRQQVRSILFENSDTSFTFDDKDPSESDENFKGSLLFNVRRHMISVTSSLRREADVCIVSVGGATIAAFNIQPGETIDTPILGTGVYIIRADGGRYLKKFVIRK